MTEPDARADALLFAGLRSVWEDVDPAPADLVDRMIAAVAAADLSREYALLTLVEGAESAVRGDAETTTLQFSDGTISVLLHVSNAGNGHRRVDGWVDADAAEIRLVQGERTWSAAAGPHGRFAFDDVPHGLSRVQLITPGAEQDLITPQFEV